MKQDGKGGGPKSGPPGFRDVADQAGVSVTTVERVLNERGSVTPATRIKVLRAAQSLGMRRVLPRPDFGNLRIEAILPINPTPFWAKLSDALKNSARTLPKGITVHRTFVPENSPEAIIGAIERSSLKRAALIIASEVHEDVHDSLSRAMQRGEIVVSVSSSSPGVHAFSGIDNVAAGRTAASLVNFGLRGGGERILVLQATASLQSHRDRVSGFLESIGSHHDVLTVVTQEEPGSASSSLQRVLSTQWLPAAIYETGDSGSEMATAIGGLAIKPIWISHERNHPHEELLKAGLLDFVMDQDPIQQARWALDQILADLGIEVVGAGSVPRPELRLFCSENIPSD